MPLQVESLAPKKEVNDLLRDVTINSCAVITGLLFRDCLLSITAILNPTVPKNKITFNVFLFAVVLLITIVLCISWR